MQRNRGGDFDDLREEAYLADSAQRFAYSGVGTQIVVVHIDPTDHQIEVLRASGRAVVQNATSKRC